MTWADFYLICFLVGFALSLLTFLLGSFDLNFPHLHGDMGHIHIHMDAGAHGGGAHAVGHAEAGHAGGGHSGLNSADAEMSWFNFGTLTAFLAWFGGTGFLLTRYSGIWFWFVLLISMLVGAVGASIVFWFIAKVLMKHDKALDPIDYEMVGVLGIITVPIREQGTGEIVFSQEGVRRCSGARSESGAPISKQTEVVVTRYEKGIAYVRPWDELTNETTTTEKSQSADVKCDQ